jgi:hypothetical protein
MSHSEQWLLSTTVYQTPSTPSPAPAKLISTVKRDTSWPPRGAGRAWKSQSWGLFSRNLPGLDFYKRCWSLFAWLSASLTWLFSCTDRMNSTKNCLHQLQNEKNTKRDDGFKWRAYFWDGLKPPSSSPVSSPWLGNHRAMDALVENHWSLNWTIFKLVMLWLSYHNIWLVIKWYKSHCIPYAGCNGKLIELNGGIFAPHVRPCGFSFCRRKMGAFDERIEMSLIKNPKILMFM